MRGSGANRGASLAGEKANICYRTCSIVKNSKGSKTERVMSKSKADKRRAFLEWAESIGPLPTSIMAVGSRPSRAVLVMVEKPQAQEGLAPEARAVSSRSRFDRDGIA